MSLKPLETHFSATQSLYAPYTTTGGGGGGGGPVISTTSVIASTLSVSSITGGGPGQSLNFPNGFDMPTGASIIMAGGAGALAGDIEFPGNNGQLLGVSTINGAAYPPAGGAASISTITTGGANVGSAIVTLNPTAAPVTAGKWYNASIKLTNLTGIVSTPTQGDHCSILADTTVLGTIDCVQYSTMKALGNPLGMAFTGAVQAVGAGLSFYGLMNTAATCSTFVATDGVAWLTPLN